MNSVLTEDDFEPFTSSGYAWRWRDPNCDVLPGDVLRSIRALRRDKAEQVFRPSLLIDKWIRDRPAREIETDAHDETLVSEWLRECGADTDMVIAS